MKTDRSAFVRFLFGLVILVFTAILCLAVYKSFVLVDLKSDRFSSQIGQVIDQKETADRLKSILERSPVRDSLDQLKLAIDQVDTSLANVELAARLKELSGSIEKVRLMLDSTQNNLRDSLGVLQTSLASTVDQMVQSAYVKSEHLYAFILELLLYIVVILLAIYLILNPGILRILGVLLRMIRGFKGFGLELSFDEDGDGRSREVRNTFESGFDELRVQVKRELETFDAQNELYIRFSKVVEGIHKDPAIVIKKMRDFEYRCTIHVPDLLFKDYLCQLTDYCPGQSDTRGRVWTIFHGIIGKVWRLGGAEIIDFKNISGSDLLNGLVSNFGMTQDEVRDPKRDFQSFLCVALKDDDDVTLGVFYMDAKPSGFFTPYEQDEEMAKDKNEVIEIVRDKCQKLLPILKKYSNLKGKAPHISFR